MQNDNLQTAQEMIKFNPIEVLLWSLRRSEKDVVKIYDKLGPLMQLGANTDMLNFGLWTKGAKTLLEAQQRMCEYVCEFGDFHSAKMLMDIGSGYCRPAILWKKLVPNLEILCLDINLKHLNSSSKEHLRLVNCTSTKIPLTEQSCQRIVALESAQHFRPLGNFFKESKRIISKNGLLTLAIPVTENKKFVTLDLGILNLTWASERYSKNYIKSQAIEAGFKIKEIEEVGSDVYEPLADYYIENRAHLRFQFTKSYSNRIEELIFRSIQKMKKLSEKKVIEYLLVSFE